MKKPLLALILSVVTLSMLNCAQQPAKQAYVKDGKAYGTTQGTFRHRWWNYYERGLSFAEGEFYAEAIKDLKQAIRQRDKDQRRARTYGMHFVDYFPHRELGVIFYQTGNYDDALKELKLSLDQYPSAKAQFYLDRVRRKLIVRGQIEIPPPVLKLDTATETILTKADPVVVSGVAEDPNYIRRLAINKAPVFMEGAQPSLRFKKKLALAQGSHSIEIVAENLAGKITRKQISIRVDREGPTITIDQLDLKSTGRGKQLEIKGSIFDPSGISTLTLNGRQLNITRGEEVLFATRQIISGKEIKLSAADSLANATVAQIPISSLQSDSPTRVMFACTDCSASLPWLAGIFGKSDTRAPEISLKGWTESQTVYLAKIYVEGQVRDENKIVDLSLNDKPIRHRQGNLIFFNQFVELKEGQNTLKIKARDEKGNAAETVIAVHRRIPRALQLEERLSLTVLPFEQKGALSETSYSFQDNLTNAMVNQNRFQVVERNKLDAILEEQKLSRTKLIDEKTALQLGKMIASQTIVGGSIIQTRTGTEIIARMIDTETSAVLAAFDVYGEAANVRLLNDLSEGLAIKFHREFPLLEGLVVDKKGKAVFTDLGHDAVKIQRRLIVYRDAPIKHPVTGKLLGSNNEILGRGRVTQVMPELSKVEMLNGQSTAIKPLDKVITE